MAQENLLNFKRTLSVDQFKTEVNCDKISIRKNDATGKHFFVAGEVTGAISAKLDYKENPAISRVESTEGEEFWLLHKRSDANEVDAL